MAQRILSEQEKIRRNSLQELYKLGINPFPAKEFKVTAYSKEIVENYSEEKSNYQEISIAGRIMSRRIMGKASFIEIQDEKGKIQAYVNRDIICPDEDKSFYI